jgi:hypothetical protein
MNDKEDVEAFKSELFTIILNANYVEVPKLDSKPREHKLCYVGNDNDTHDKNSSANSLNIQKTEHIFDVRVHNLVFNLENLNLHTE